MLGRTANVLSNLGRNHLARAAPRREPVDKHHRVLGEGLLEVVGAESSTKGQHTHAKNLKDSRGSRSVQTTYSAMLWTVILGSEAWKDRANVSRVAAAERGSGERIAVVRTGRRNCLVEDIDRCFGGGEGWAAWWREWEGSEFLYILSHVSEARLGLVLAYLARQGNARLFSCTILALFARSCESLSLSLSLQIA